MLYKKKIDSTSLHLLYYANKNTLIMAMNVDVISQRIEVLEKQMAALLDDTNTPKNSHDKSKKTKKTPKDTAEPKTTKRRLSGYLVFSKAMRDEVKKDLFGDEKPNNSKIMTELGRRWKELNDEERDKWNAKALEASTDDT